MRITRIRAKNFRCLGDVDLELRPFTVVIGPNGAGKSSLLEAIRVLGSIHQGSGAFSDTFARYGGFRATVSYFASDPKMLLGITLGQPNAQVKYDVALMGEGAGYFVAWEKLEKLLPPRFGLERDDTNGAYMGSQSPNTQFQIDHGPRFAFEVISPVPKELRGVFPVGQKTSMFQAYKFQPNERVRAPQQLQLSEVPSNEGTDLFSALYRMKTEQPGHYRDLMDVMRCAVPELEEIEYPVAGLGHVNLTWKQKNLPSKLFYAYQLSDGTLRLLWLMTVLHAVSDDGLVLIDEPELSLHPQWLMLLVSIMRKVSARTTLVVATQSAEFIRWVKPEELVIADMTESGARFSWASDRSDLSKWLEDFTLSELWTMGELGGRR